ncbi:hypothetical protein CFBP5875_23810 (plasmid) [Agrobacterium pusense]|nr:hypothetical protein CFBP5875_23810 [Agrobacterium pusense]
MIIGSTRPIARFATRPEQSFPRIKATAVPPPRCPLPSHLRSSFHGKVTRSFSMETTLEVVTTRPGRREIHRQWPDEIKARIV